MDLAIYLHAMTALFVIIDPIGTALIFNALTASSDRSHRTKMALKSVLISSFTLILFGNYGEALFSELGISINSLRISGGLLLFYTAFKMITEETTITVKEKNTDISVFPLSIPLLSGPGTLTLAVLLFSNTNDFTGSLSISGAIVSILLLTFILMIASQYLKRIIGRTGDEILKRFFGVILAALAIQFIFDGVNNLMT